jgi:hypothetical protein
MKDRPSSEKKQCMSLLLGKCRVEPIANRQLVIMSAPPPPQPKEKNNKGNKRNKKLMVDSDIPARIIQSKVANPAKNTRSKKKI